MPQPREIHRPRHAHPCPARTPRGTPGGPLRSPRSRAVLPARARTPGDRVELTSEQRHARSPTAMAALAALDRPATPTGRRQRSPDLIQVVSPILTQLTA